MHSTDVLHFTPMHKSIRIQLPDLRILETQVDFSVKTFSAVVQLCKELGIRHPEELSFCKPLELAHLKNNYHDIDKKKYFLFLYKKLELMKQSIYIYLHDKIYFQ